MQKIMIPLMCLGILLLGIVMVPGVFAVDYDTTGGCGEGTVLVDGVCQLPPAESSGCGEGTVLVDGVCQLLSAESSGCGEGTVLVNGVCQLSGSSGTSIPPLYIAGGAAAIGAAVIGIVFAVKRGSGGTSTPKPAKQDLDDYEEQYLRRQGQRPTRKPAETRLTSSSCNSCGKPLKSTAKFCGKCGSKQ